MKDSNYSFEQGQILLLNKVDNDKISNRIVLGIFLQFLPNSGG